ncbi:MAG: hypothetical protein ABSC76_15085, partial [Terracidiphilus sp.]
MTTPPPTPTHKRAKPATVGTLHAVPADAGQGPLIRQIPSAARLAWILHGAATDLWEASALTDPAEMYEEGRRVA